LPNLATVRPGKILTLVQTWLVLDFFGEARRGGGQSSTLTTAIFSQAFLALVVAAMLYPEIPPVPFAAANLCLSSLLMGLSALGEFAPQNRRAADAVLLGTAPVGGLLVTCARGLHGSFHIGLLTAGMALPPAVLSGWLCGRWWVVPLYVVLACLCAGLASGALHTGMRASLRVLGAERTALLVGTAKAVLLAGGVVLFALGFGCLRKDADALPIGRIGAELLPPYHAARFLADPLGEAWRLPLLLGTGAVLLLAAALLGEREPARTGRVRARGPLVRLAHALGGRGPTLALTHFTATMLWRSPRFRARVLPLFGVPAAMVFLAYRGEGAGDRELLLGMVLQFPALYVPFLIGFLPAADQPDTDWVFRAAPPVTTAHLHRAVFAALVTHVLLPIHALAAALLLAASVTWQSVLALVGFALGIAVLHVRAEARTLREFPFSCASQEAPGIDLGKLLASALVLCGAGAGMTLLPGPVRWFAVAAALLAAGLALRRPASGPNEVIALDPGVAAGSTGSPARGTNRPVAPESLRRELMAIGFLYAVVCVLPCLIGFAFAP
jgi:hypothetical protein